MMMNWWEDRAKVKERVCDLRGFPPEAVEGYATLAAWGENAAHLDDMTRELIALPVAVTAR